MWKTKIVGRPLEVSQNVLEKLKQMVMDDRLIMKKSLCGQLNVECGTTNLVLLTLSLRRLC